MAAVRADGIRASAAGLTGSSTPAPVAWVRHSPGGSAVITEQEVATWASRCVIAVLDPWESAAAASLKASAPHVVVLCRKDMATVDQAEPGPIYSSGISYEQAERTPAWFAVDRAGDRITSGEDSGRWHMRVWDPAYRAAWVAGVLRELDDSPFDGVLAVGDLEENPRLNLPLPDLGSRTQQREANDHLVAEAGAALRAQGKILVTSVGDARRSPRRWVSLSEWGGVFEPGWLSTVEGRILDPGTARQQTERLNPQDSEVVPTDRWVLVRLPVSVDSPTSDGSSAAEEAMVRYGLAAFWVFGGGRGIYAATSLDGQRSHWIPEMQWDLGEPIDPPESVVNLWTRTFTKGWVAVNLASDGRRRRHVTLPSGYMLPDGSEPPEQVVLGAHQGLLLRRVF